MCRTVESKKALIDALEPRRLLSAQLVSDLSRGDGSQPDNFAGGDKTVFFTAKTFTAGRELWTTDGTAAGTHMVVDLAPGKDDAVIQKLTVAGRYAYFTAKVNNAYSLYRSDGTARGTIALMALEGSDRFRGQQVAAGNSVYFELPDAKTRTDALFVTDGTTARTQRLATTGLPDFVESAATRSTSKLLGVGGKNYSQLWFSDGTKKGTHRINISGATGYGALTSAGGNLYFGARIKDRSTLYMLDANNTPVALKTVDAFRLSADATAKAAYMIAVENRKDTKDHGSLFRVEGTELTHIAFDGDFTSENDHWRLAGDNDAIVGFHQNKKSADLVRLNQNTNTLDSVGSVPLTDVQNVRPIGNFIYVVGNNLRSQRRVLMKLDVRTGKSVDAGVQLADQTFPDTQGYPLGGINGKLLVSIVQTDFRTELHAIDLVTGADTVLTNQRGDATDTTIKGQGENNGRHIAISNAMSATTVDYIDTSGNVRTVFTAKTDPFDAPRIIFNGDTAFVGLNTRAGATFGDGSGLVIFVLLRIDLNTGKTVTLANESGVSGGALLAVSSGGNAFYVPNYEYESHTHKHPTVLKVGPDTTTPTDIGVPAAGMPTGDGVILGGRLLVDTPDGLSAFDGTQWTLLFHSPTTTDNITGVVSFSIAPIIAGKCVYAFDAGHLIRTDGTTAGTRTLYTPAQMVAGMTKFNGLLLSHDGKWMYAVVALDDTTWKIARFAADGSGGPQTVAAVNSAWNDAEQFLPTLQAAVGDDLVISGDFTNATDREFFRVRIGNPNPIHLQRDGYGYGAAAAGEEGIALTRDDSLVDLLRDGVVQSLPGLSDHLSSFDGKGIVFDGGSIYAVMSTRSTGTELFRYRVDTRIAGQLFNDADGNGSRGSIEGGLAGCRVYIDLNDDGRWEKTEASVLTDSTGRFEFLGLDAGTYKLRVSTGTNLRMTTGNVYTVKLPAGQVVNKRFGARAVV